MNVDLIKDIPENPGVYIFRNEKNRPIYVGKAINLKNRVKSYFQNKDALGPKTSAMVGKISKVEHIKVETEVEALLLEADLIKRYKPPYNIDLKDDKFYKYIKIDKQKLEVEGEERNIAIVGTARSQTTKNAKYFGPYPESSSIHLILKTLRRIFPFRDCSKQKFNRYRKAKRPCLYGHIGVCPAPCQGSKEVDENNQNITKIREYLSGNRKKLFQDLEREMKKYSKSHEFEKAAVIRDQLTSYEYLTQNIRNIKEYIDYPSLIDDSALNGVKELIEALKKETDFNFDNKEIPQFRIEIFDISNMQGKNAVGSMVVLTGGSPDKKEYRRFKIKSKDTPDDYHMMKEMLERRFKKPSLKQKSLWSLPDLIVIDGGKGQLSAALEILDKSEITIPIIGLAKREEEIIYFENNEFKVIRLDHKSPALKTLQKGRDESHRFGINYYRSLHRKSLYK